MPANLEPQFWEQPEKQLYRSPNSHRLWGRRGTYQTAPELHISAFLTWEEGRQGWGGKKEEDKERDEYAACLVDLSYF